MMMRKFRKHKLAKLGLWVLIALYTIVLFSEFFAVQDYISRDTKSILQQPMAIHLWHEGKFVGPFVYTYKRTNDPVTLKRIYTEVKEEDEIHRLGLFVKGDSYKLWGLIDGDIHFVGTQDGSKLYLFGTDANGRDLFSRVMMAVRLSLTIGLVGVFFTFILGCFFGGISGYYGGVVDMVVQRIIEFLSSMPSIPLWMALAAAFPKEWSAVQVYFMITLILSLIGWCSLARTVRGKILQMRSEDFVTAAKLAGASDRYLITKHLLPGFASYLIVSVTLSVPQMILGETSLSFLGIGLRSPAVSLGVLLKDAQNISAIANSPWLMIPGIFIIITVMAFNFLGDGLRDAADPYK
ncbi:MAG: ABC transporter permease [Clostridia bacterium]